MNTILHIPTILQFIQSELKRERAYLLPLRLFMGLGWLRTGVEKAMQADWLSGELLAHKLSHQVSAGEVYFPFYEMLVNDLFLPNVLLMSWIILIAEFAVGLGIMFGTFTNGALLGALFMNLNFVMAGWVNPSAFYIIIQVLLLVKGSGMVLGGDQLIGRYFDNVWLVSEAPIKLSIASRRAMAVLTGAFWVLGATCLLYVRDFTPGGSVDDPAMLMFIMSMMTGITTLILYVRSTPDAVTEELDAPMGIPAMTVSMPSGD